jgi:hypothetical protein
MYGLSLGSGAAEPFDESQIFDIAFDYYKKIGLLDTLTIEEVAAKLSETKSLIERIKNEGVEGTPTIPGFESYMVGFLKDSVLVMEKVLQHLEAERRTDAKE